MLFYHEPCGRVHSIKWINTCNLFMHWLRQKQNVKLKNVKKQSRRQPKYFQGPVQFNSLKQAFGFWNKGMVLLNLFFFLFPYYKSVSYTAQWKVRQVNPAFTTCSLHLPYPIWVMSSAMRKNPHVLPAFPPVLLGPKCWMPLAVKHHTLALVASRLQQSRHGAWHTSEGQKAS